MKIFHYVFVNNWSWGLVSKELITHSQHEIITETCKRTTIEPVGYDVILLQQITLTRWIKADMNSIICRLGGNLTFDKNVYAFDKILSKVHSVVATNHFLYDIAKRVNPNTYLIPNGLDLNEWGYITKRPKVFTVGFAGNISNDLYKNYKGFQYVEKACKELGIPLKTALYGKEQIPHDKMRTKFYKKISVLVHPTKGEGCSNVIMEALACGIPVITTRQAGYHGEMLKNGFNVLFCGRDTESVKQCILRIKNNPRYHKFLKKQSRAFAEQHHNIKEIAKQYDEIFQKCYKDRHKMNNQGVLIKYTGEKPEKKVIWGGRVFVFSPYAWIKDEKLIDFLVAPERRGLFMVVNRGEI